MTERFSNLVQLGNALSLDEGGWAQLAPFGDHPGVAFTNEGPREAIQRITPESGAALRKSLLSFTGKASRFFRSVPIYNGHPDAKPISDQFPDREVKGHIGDIQVRSDGIYVLPILNEAGAKLLNAGERLGLSAYVDAAVTGESDGKLVAEWSALRSVGMTDRPNLPVELLNSQNSRGSEAQPQSMTSPLIIAALASAGIQIANGAGEDQIARHVETLVANARAATDAVAAKDAEITALKASIANANTALSNEQAARRKDLLDERVASGAITEADRALWDGRLTANFANEAASLRGLPAKVKTGSQLANSGTRRGTDSDPGTAEAYLATVRDSIKAGTKPAEAVRSAVATIPNSYAAWRDAGCPAI